VLDYDPFVPEVFRNPYPYYARLRDEAPAYYLAKYDCWAISRFADVWAVSSDTEHFTVTRGTAPAQIVTKDQPLLPLLNSMDPPAHTALRARVRPRFLPKSMREIEASVRGMVEELLAPLFAAGGGDVVAELGSKLSSRVACLVIGLPVADGDYLHGLVTRYFTHDPSVQGMSEDGWAAMGELTRYCIEHVRAERRTPSGSDSPIAAICASEVDGARLSDEVAASHVTELIVGGSVTFPKALANGLVRLAEHPDQRARLARDASGIPGAIDEILRYDMPTQFLCRSVSREISLHGQTLRPGQGVLLLYPAANRDPREFENPDVFDIARRPARIASFGAGQHACLGQHVAKLEARLCYESILARAPEYRVDLARAERHNTEFVQGFAKLPIAF
jgi:cytochrome P450